MAGMARASMSCRPRAGAVRAPGCRIVAWGGTQLRRDGGAGDLPADQSLDLCHLAHLLIRHKSICGAVCLRPCGPTDAVNIILPIMGHIVVDDEFNLVNVDAAAEDVGGNEDRQLLAGKLA